MAGTPVGTIFAEIDLDRTKFDRSQNAILDSATATTLNVEKAWKQLSSKSDLIFDAQRQSFQNAYDRIASSATSTTDAIIRAEQAKKDKISAINEQQFGKQVSFIDSLKSNWIAASAAIVGAWMLVNKASNLMDMGAKALQIESSFKIMAESSGKSSEEMIANMKKATQGAVEESALMQKATKLMTLGYDPEQIERFSNVAITASQIAGTSVTEMYDKLSDAIATRMPRALVQVGAVTREQMQIVTAAIKAGASEWSLYELAMANLELKQKMLQGTQNEATLSMQRFHAQIKETQETLGKGLVAAAQRAYGVLQAMASSVFALVAAYEYLVHGEEAAKRAILAGAELAEKAKANISGTAEVQEKATKTEIDDARKKVDAQVAALKAIADAKKNAGALEKSMMDQAHQIYEAEVNDAQNLAKIRILNGEDALKVELDTIRARQIALNKHYDSQSATLMKLSMDETVRQEKLKDLYLKYSKEYDKDDNQRQQTVLQIRNKDLAEYTTYLQHKLSIDHSYIDQATSLRAGDISAQEVALKDSRAHFLITEANYIEQMKRLTVVGADNSKAALDDKFDSYIKEKQKEMDNEYLTKEQRIKINDEMYQAYVKYEGDKQALTISTNAKLVELDNQVPKSFIEGWDEGFREYHDKANDAFKAGKDLATTTANDMDKAFENFFDYTSSSFLKLRDLVNTVAHDIYIALMQSLSGVVGGSGGGIFGGLFSTLGGLLGIGGGGGGAGAGAFDIFGSFMEPLEVGVGTVLAPIGLAAGGIMTQFGQLELQKYSSGGVANRPQLAMFGEGRNPEAYVPLPDGRSIPVTMQGGADQSSPSWGNQGGVTNIHFHGTPNDTMTLGDAAKLMKKVHRNGHLNVRFM